MEDVPQAGNWRRMADIFGWLAIVCWLPYVVLLLVGRWLHPPDWMAQFVILYLFTGPFIAATLAVIAATGRRWQWMLLAVASLAAVAYFIWYESRHPFDL